MFDDQTNTVRKSANTLLTLSKGFGIMYGQNPHIYSLSKTKLGATGKGGHVPDAMPYRENAVFRMEDYPSDWNLDWHGHGPGTPDWSETSRFIAYSLVSG